VEPGVLSVWISPGPEYGKFVQSRLRLHLSVRTTVLKIRKLILPGNRLSLESALTLKSVSLGSRLTETGFQLADDFGLAVPR